MARTYARVKTAIWADDQFRTLPPLAQHLYFVLLTSNSLNYCGVADWRPKRIAAGAKGWTEAEVRRAADVLAGDLYIAIDEETEEVLVRSFIRNDGFMEQPNVVAAMVRAYGQVASSDLRGVVVHELLRLHIDNPDLKGWKVASSLLNNPSVDPAEHHSTHHSVGHSLDDSGDHSPDGPVGVEPTMPVITASLPTPSPTPTPQALSPSEPRIPRSNGKGTRIPDPFIVDEAMKDWAVDRGYTAEWCMAQTERFINYWTAKPGKDGTKSDWRATWRNWILKAADDLPAYSGKAAGKDGLFDRAMERAQQRLEIVQ